MKSADVGFMRSLVSYSHDGLEFECPCWIPPFTDSPKPALFVFPNLWGPNAYWEEMLEVYASLGYPVMVVDMYGKDTRPQTHPEAMEVIGALKQNRELVRKRALKALEEFTGLPEVDSERVAALGYCFGGMCVLELARISAPVLGVISMHGALDTPLPATGAGEVKPKVLVLHGSEDPSIPDSDVSDFIGEMRAAEADWQLVHFGGQVHAFTDLNANRPGQAEYHALTDQRSWKMFTNFLDELF
ncbi:MAG: dienelactone hydrolase family protein [Verrucomicrobiota bacterium]